MTSKKTTELVRSLDAVATTWEQNDVSLSEMLEHLEELVEIAAGRSNYNQLVNKINIQDDDSEVVH